MRLYELAFGCWIYRILTGDDSRIGQLQEKTGGQVDPHNPGHRGFLFEWLNQWGCRQFSKAHHIAIAGQSLDAWANSWLTRLPSVDMKLETIGHAQIDILGAAYHDLRNRQAGTRTLKNGTISQVRYGPVGAAKTLFALRPNVCPPWDRYTLDALGLDYSKSSYCQYLRRVHADLQKVSNQAGVKIDALPNLVKRPKSTPPKLIDEYYWVTVTRGFAPPSKQTLEQWLAWVDLE